MVEPYDALSHTLWAYGQGNNQRIDELLDPLLSEFPATPSVLHVAATVAASRGQVSRSLELSRAATAAIACREAVAFEALGRPEDAKAAYLDALKVDTYNTVAANSLSEFYRKPVAFDPDIAKLGRAQHEFYATPIGNYFLPADAPHDIVARRMKAGLMFQPEVVSAVASYVRPGTTVIDLGANFGQMSLAFAELVDTGEIISVEADDFVFALLCKNIAANKKGNIIPIFAAAFDKDGESLVYPEADFIHYGSYGSYGLDLRQREGRKVRTITVDGLGIERPVSVMKIDIQGSDLFAMRGAVKTIERFKPAIIFEYEEDMQVKFGTSKGDYLDFIEQIDYRIDVEMGQDYVILPRT